MEPVAIEDPSRFPACMPSFDPHGAEATASFGQPHAEVHLWLDELAGKPPWGMRHRRVRHHAARIEQVRRRWRDGVAAAARQHIEADLRQEGWNATHPFPRNEQE